MLPAPAALLIRLCHALPAAPATWQVMKPTPADVICLCALLRGAERLSETKKGQWWKAAATLAASPNVSSDHQRDLQHLLLLREHGWDAASAAQAAQELDVRKQAEAAAAALEEARMQRQAQEEATARAAGELGRAEGQLKAAAARLAELQKEQAAAEAAAAAARDRQQSAQAAAEAAATRRAESDRAASAAKKQAADAASEAARARQQALETVASAAAAAPGASSGAGAGERGRHWYYATTGDGRGPYGPFTAAELVAWQYQDVMLGGELQVGGAGGQEGPGRQGRL